MFWKIWSRMGSFLIAGDVGCNNVDSTHEIFWVHASFSHDMRSICPLWRPITTDPNPPWVWWDVKNWKNPSRSPSNRATCPAAVYVDLSSLRAPTQNVSGMFEFQVWRYSMISLWLGNDFRWFKWVGIATWDTFGYAGLFSLWSHRFGFLCQSRYCNAYILLDQQQQPSTSCCAHSDWKPHGPTVTHRQKHRTFVLESCHKATRCDFYLLRLVLNTYLTHWET